jgi:N utilization substance protein B
MLYVESIPVSVSINEAVELAKTFATSDDASYINGILGSISKRIEA